MTPPPPPPKPTILVVDDEPVNLRALQQILQQDYELLFATGGEGAISLAREWNPDLILLDIIMDGIDGFETCRRLKADKLTERIPVIFVTVLSETENEAEGFAVGAVDYISKPIRPSIVKARVATHLSLVASDSLAESHLEIVRRLGRAAEFKDDETSGHIMRMSHYAKALALGYGCPPDWSQDLCDASPMHDVGKIGIPDAYLRKPGKLDEAEWSVIRRHPEMGASIIGEHSSRMLQMAYTVAIEHHEKWDGTGYPHGLKGEEISLEARIVAIADVFDALSSVRPYKPAWSFEQASQYIIDQSGQHFDPELCQVFADILPEIRRIRERFADK